ncbi:MAG: quinolinate synthase NadA [Nanoarchaeota archaeon]|nr:quinolinate synthase NadA [Nanoarchaeota archaeon]MBU1005431.1 quinolinate synthase NadA [Nanoarchaeota archaeon]MBU1945562.1 quinolinate synthase NadA [Nanoarchaeota archaeon]
MDTDMIGKINRLKKEKNAVILAHNYQRPEIYEVADFLGDSLELAKKAVNTDAKIIVFCGVDFMAESAKILNPEKMVLHPEELSVCPMAAMVTVECVLEAKQKYPKSVIVSYINTTADVKAVSDICCTSANAVKVVNSLKEDEVIFTPDRNLGTYVQTKSKKKIILLDGHCYVHDNISVEDVKKAKELHPDAEVMVHPECRMEVIKEADAVCSTSQMIKYSKESSASEFISVTECGMAIMLKREIPNKKFWAVGGTCLQMKNITLEKVYDCLFNETGKVELDQNIMDNAKKALDAMLKVV